MPPFPVLEADLSAPFSPLDGASGAKSGLLGHRCLELDFAAVPPFAVELGCCGTAPPSVPPLSAGTGLVTAASDATCAEPGCVWVCRRVTGTRVLSVSAVGESWPDVGADGPAGELPPEPELE